MPNVDVNGTSLAYVEQGDGPPVVFVHGGSGDLRVWAKQLQALDATHRAIALSCRGYYPNDALQPGTPVSLDAHVQDLGDFIHALDLPPVHLVGHSSPGGFGSLLLASRQPDLLRSLVLVEPPAFPLLGVSVPPMPPQILKLLVRQPRVALAFMSFGARGIGPATKAFQRGDDAEGLRIFMRANLGDEAMAAMSPARFEQALGNIAPLKAQLRAGFPAIREQDVQRIVVPTLLISGEKSNAVLRGVTDRLQALLPNVERQTIKNASHNMFESDPEPFNDALKAFFARHAA